MSVTVADLIKLPSLRQSKVLGGHRGLTKIVSSISVLESTDPGVLINGLFPQGEFYGSEIVITGFMNALDDVDCQCANIRRLAECGEVGLILYYVGAYLPYVDQRLIDLANELDFVLICMPEGQKNLRYSEVISDVMECIFHDRMQNDSIVSEILARVSSLPQHQRTVNTVLKMLSDRISASVILCDRSFHILNLVAWPRGLEQIVKCGLENMERYPAANASMNCSFLPDSQLYRLLISLEFGQGMELLLLKEGTPLSQRLLEQAADVVRLSINIWGQRHDQVAIHELVRAILQDDPIKMRRLADIFHIDVASIHEMWILCGESEQSVRQLRTQASAIQELLEDSVDTVVADLYDDKLILFLSTPPSQREIETQMAMILKQTGADDSTITLTRYSGLKNTAEVRRVYLCHQKHLSEARKIFPLRRIFCQGETEYAETCRQLIDSGEQSVAQYLQLLNSLQTDNKESNLVETLCVYLLDSEFSVTRTAELMFLHKNTIKYRIQRISDLLGYRPDKMPEAMKLYYAAAVSRLLL